MKVNSRRQVLILLSKIASAAAIFVSPPFAFSASYKHLGDVEGVGIWARDIAGEERSIQDLATKQLRSIFEKSPFKEWPKESRADLLLDRSHPLSSGFWARSLKSPANRSAVRVEIEALVEDPYPRVLGHELFHLLHDQKRPEEVSWVREGLALLEEYRLTGRMNPSLDEAYRNPETSLVADLNPGDEPRTSVDQHSAQYGLLSLYFYYLYKNCGKDDLFAKLWETKSKSIGIQFVDEVLHDMASSKDVCSSFRESFKKFAHALHRPRFTHDEDFVLTGSPRTAVRKTRVALSPFSSLLFEIKEGETCPDSTESIGGSFCLEIRLD